MAKDEKKRTADLAHAATAVTLRPVVPEDEELLLDIYASTREEEIKQVGWSEEQKRMFLRWQLGLQRQDYELRFPRADYSIVLFEGEPSGRLWVARVEDQIRLLDIAILPAYQNRRIGTHLLHTLIEESERVGKPLRHWIYKLNTGARRFYERLGFRLIEDDRAYLFMERPPGGAHNAPAPSSTANESDG